jgi:hypothetical protein
VADLEALYAQHLRQAQERGLTPLPRNIFEEVIAKQTRLGGMSPRVRELAVGTAEAAERRRRGATYNPESPAYESAVTPVPVPADTKAKLERGQIKSGVVRSHAATRLWANPDENITSILNKLGQ